MPRILLLALAGLALSGCASYITPGPKADLQAFAPASIQEGFATKPVATFPASIAAVHVQGPGYSNQYIATAGGRVGDGRYSIITTRDAETEGDITRLAKLPQVAGVVAINRLLIPEHLTGDREVREAAARLHADMILLYTFDTAFFDQDLAKPLSVITLGLSPTRKISVATTISGLLIDTRTGYVYAAYEDTTRADTLSTSWGTRDSADEIRRGAERAAFTKLVDDVATSWSALVARHAKS